MHYDHCYPWICTLRGPEDDSERVETCRPKVTFYVLKTVVFDWYVTRYIYNNVTLHF